MPFRSNDTKSFRMGFTSARGFDRISFQDKRFRLGKATISDLRVTENLTVGGKLEAPIVGWDNGEITATTTLTASGTTQDYLKVNSANAVTLTTLTGPLIAAAFRSQFKRPTVQVGDVFKQTISKVGANDITLSAGTGVTFTAMTSSSATTIAANKSASYFIKCTNATVGSETFTYFRVDTEDTAGGGGGLAASDNITFTGDCSFTHANGLTLGSGSAAGVLDTTGTQNLELKTGSARGSIIIADAADGDIEIKPNGGGIVVVGSGLVNQAGVLESNGDNDLTLQTGNAITGTITITDGANGNILIAPNGTGRLNLSGLSGIVRETKFYFDAYQGSSILCLGTKKGDTPSSGAGVENIFQIYNSTYGNQLLHIVNVNAQANVDDVKDIAASMASFAATEAMNVPAGIDLQPENDKGFEIYFQPVPGGNFVPNMHTVFASGTDSGFIEVHFHTNGGSIDKVTVCGCGFRLASTFEANHAIDLDDVDNNETGHYSDFAFTGIIGTGGDIKCMCTKNGVNMVLSSPVNVTNDTIVDTGRNVTEGRSFIVRVELSSDGTVVFKSKVNSVITDTPDKAATTKANFQFDTDATDLLIPYITVFSGANDCDVFIKKIVVHKDLTPKTYS